MRSSLETQKASRNRKCIRNYISMIVCANTLQFTAEIDLDPRERTSVLNASKNSAECGICDPISSTCFPVLHSFPFRSGVQIFSSNSSAALARTLARRPFQEQFRAFPRHSRTTATRLEAVLWPHCPAVVTFCDALSVSFPMGWQVVL